MSNSIYNINNWATSTLYQLNDIVFNSPYYYYCIISHTSTASFDSTKFGGTTTFNGATKPNFIWKPAYNAQTDLSPRVKNIVLGDGYEQRVQDGINNTLLKFNFQFNGRDLSETTAILHFLKQRAGAESFVFTPFAPFGRASLYKCQNYSSEFVFVNNFNVQASFNEVPN